MPDYIYAMGNPDGTGPIKIGRTTSLSKRLSMVRVYCPFPVECHALIEVESGTDMEKAIHRHFAHKHVHREWFDITATEAIETFQSFDLSPPVFEAPRRHDKMGRPKTDYSKADYNKQYARDVRAIKAQGLSISVKEWREMSQPE